VIRAISPFLRYDAAINSVDGIPSSLESVHDENIAANSYFFSQLVWMQEWLRSVHRYPQFRERWHAVGATLHGKVAIDVGCGPGNVLKSLGDEPAVAIGVDVALGSLKLAKKQGYIPLHADAHHMPLRSGFADIVTLNATLHHCTDMEKVLLESARLVRPGGMLVLDHDPHLTAWHFRGLGLLAWKLRKPVYRLLNRGGHRSEGEEQAWAEKTEVHHRPGDGVTEDMVRSVLERQDFTVDVYPHNHGVGAGVLESKTGRAASKIRWAQRLSGIDPDSSAAALSLMIVARKSARSDDCA
jgi:ubiquinone/menaquinone biosynthesis C-methylase UbiE